MILADTSVWFDHLRKGDSQLASLLNQGLVLMHPFIMGEIALGNLRHRKALLDDLANLPEVRVASDEEVRLFIEGQKIAGTGIGYLDVHLLVSASLDAAKLWTRDKRLSKEAERLGLA